MPLLYPSLTLLYPHKSCSLWRQRPIIYTLIGKHTGPDHTAQTKWWIMLDPNCTFKQQCTWRIWCLFEHKPFIFIMIQICSFSDTTIWAYNKTRGEIYRNHKLFYRKKVTNKVKLKANLVTLQPTFTFTQKKKIQLWFIKIYKLLVLYKNI